MHAHTQMCMPKKKIIERLLNFNFHSNDIILFFTVKSHYHFANFFVVVPIYEKGKAMKLIILDLQFSRISVKLFCVMHST